MSLDIKLASGRIVWLQRFSIWRTVPSNVLDGNPDRIYREVWESLPGLLRTEFGEGVVIREPPNILGLPDYTCVAELHSDPLPADPREDYSFLTVCWFVEEPEGSLAEIIRHGLAGLRWEKHAQNWTM